jgi:hypothetical protein
LWEWEAALTGAKTLILIHLESFLFWRSRVTHRKKAEIRQRDASVVLVVEVGHDDTEVDGFSSRQMAASKGCC